MPTSASRGQAAPKPGQVVTTATEDIDVNQSLPIPAAEPPGSLLIGARELAALLSWSVRSVRRGNAAGLLPPPVKVGGSVRWRREEVERWIAAGCPPRSPSEGAARSRGRRGKAE
jgi:predicted DNA-binding transcriptional regulator AlpA